MTFTIDLETWFKHNAHPLPTSSMYMKYEPDRTKGREYLVQTRIFHRGLI